MQPALTWQAEKSYAHFFETEKFQAKRNFKHCKWKKMLFNKNIWSSFDFVKQKNKKID